MKLFAIIICFLGLIDRYSGCGPDKWECKYNKVCIDIAQRCDNDNDNCGERSWWEGWDESDEENCECTAWGDDQKEPSDKCPSEKPICSYGTCHGINSVQYAKLEGKYCSIWDGEFGSIQEAQNKCTIEEDWPNPCVGIYADRCEHSRSSFHLCRHKRNSYRSDDFLPSSNGSCVFEKHAPKIEPCRPDFCMNGGTCVVRADAPNNAVCDCQSTFTGERCDETCQSCYGAESSTRRCCQTCNEVEQAFKEKGLNFNATGVKQCDDSGINENNDDQYEVMFRKCCFEALDVAVDEGEYDGAGNLTFTESQCSKDPECTGVMHYKGKYRYDDVNFFLLCNDDDEDYMDDDCSNGIYFAKREKSKLINSRGKTKRKLGYHTDDKNMIVGSGNITSGGRAFDGHRSFGNQITSASSSDSIACDGDINTPYNCYQCFDAVAGKYFWGSSCKAKKLASADMVNGKCGLDYACSTKDIGTCPYNNYCPDNAKRTFMLGPKGSGVCSEGTQIADEKTCREACKFLNLPLGEILGNFGCYKDGQGNCYQNGRQGSGASMICKTSEKISGNGYGKGRNTCNVGEGLWGSVLESCNCTDITNSDCQLQFLEQKISCKCNAASACYLAVGNWAKAYSIALENDPECKWDPNYWASQEIWEFCSSELRSVNDEEALGGGYRTGAGNDAHKTGYHKSSLGSGNLVSGNLYSPGSDVGCLDRKHKCQSGMKCVLKSRDGKLFGECIPANIMKNVPMLGAGNDAKDIETYGSTSGSAPCSNNQCLNEVVMVSPPHEWPCSRTPCLNGGSCLDKIGELPDYTCTCPLYYYGQNCQHNVHEQVDGPVFYFGAKGETDCRYGDPIMGASECREACQTLNLPQMQLRDWQLCYKDFHGKCYQDGRNGAGATPICVRDDPMYVLAGVPSGQNLKHVNLWSSNVESLYKLELPNLIKALRKSEQPTSNFVGHLLKLVTNVKVQAFNDKTLRVKLSQIRFHSNGSIVSLDKAHQILGREISNEGAIGHTVKTFKKMLTMPFLLHTKRGLVKNVIVSQNEPAEVTEIKKLVASSLENNTSHVLLQLIMKKAIIVPLKTPRFPMRVDIGTCEAKHAEDSKQCSALRKNDHVVIKNRPCKIVEISTKTGKNGQSEMHFSGLDIFTQKKLNDICQPNDSRDVPTIKSKDYKLLSLDDGFLSLYDPDTDDQREDLKIPDDEIGEEIRAAIENDKAIVCIVLSACGEEAVIGTKQDEGDLN